MLTMQISVGVILSAGIALCLLVMGVVIAAGKADGLIAGYNTAPADEKQKVNIGRLRWLVAALLWLSGVYVVLITFISDALVCLALTMALIAIAVAAVIVANTVCFKR